MATLLKKTPNFIETSEMYFGDGIKIHRFEIGQSITWNNNSGNIIGFNRQSVTVKDSNDKLWNLKYKEII